MYHQDCEHLWRTAQLPPLHLEHQNLLDEVFAHLRESLTTLPLFQHVQDFVVTAEIQAQVNRFQSFENVIVLGTGGSSLGGQSLYSLSDKPATALHFHDNIDPHTFTKLFQELDPKTTGVVAISKSGNTSETLMQLLVCLNHWQKSGCSASDHFLIITEDNNANNAIIEIAEAQQISILFQPSTIGGRFAVFTVVGLFPALVAGLDVNLFMSGARHLLAELRTATAPLTVKAIEGAYLQYLLNQLGYSQSVMMPYIDRLGVFALWYRQLWAESLGKGGKGTTPIRALGTVDQHSQLQLYLDGPKDKFFTLICQDHTADHFAINEICYQHPALGLFQGKSMGQLLMAEQQATIATLQTNNCPTRILTLTDLDLRDLGGLMMHYVLETMAMAYLLKVNPFDQPAVEEIKIKTRVYLEQL